MHIVLKKTWKCKANQVANEKSFAFIGSIQSSEIDLINQRLATIRGIGKAGVLRFGMDGEGHYSAQMNHDAQKYREDDYMVCIFDALEQLGWTFKFQYDSEFTSIKAFSGSVTRKECFLFHK